MKSVFSLLLILFGFYSEAQVTYCLTITQTGESPTQVDYSYTIGASESVDASIFITGTNGLSGSIAAIGSPPTSANIAGTFFLAKTGVAPFTRTVSDAFPFGVLAADDGERATEICGALPIALSSFTAQAQDRKGLLKWGVSAEVNASHYEVERSTDGWQFVKLGRVAALGDTRESKIYGFTDERPAEGLNYYRLRMVDKDGSFEYSNIVQLIFNNTSTVQIAPNPTKGAVSVTFNATIEAAVRMEITDMNGRLLQTLTIERPKGASTTELDMAPFAAGVYWLNLYSNTGAERYKIVKVD